MEYDININVSPDRTSLYVTIHLDGVQIYNVGEPPSGWHFSDHLRQLADNVDQYARSEWFYNTVDYVRSVKEYDETLSSKNG